jgi:hypothetical protein
MARSGERHGVHIAFSMADFEKDLRNAFPENVKMLQKFISRDILLQN